MMIMYQMKSNISIGKLLTAVLEYPKAVMTFPFKADLVRVGDELPESTLVEITCGTEQRAKDPKVIELKRIAKDHGVHVVEYHRSGTSLIAYTGDQFGKVHGRSR